MSKKHFKELAEQLRMCLKWASAEERPGVIKSIDAVADACQQFNPRFDRARFLAACGRPMGMKAV